MTSIKELRELDEQTLNSTLAEQYKAMFEARMKRAKFELNDTSVLRKHRHRIAQIKTVLKEKQQQAK